MTVSHAVRLKGPEHASAVRRLGNAREEEARLGELGMPRTGHVGQELRSIHGRASRTRVALAQEVSRSAKRVKALRRVTEVATARRKEQGSRNA